MENEEVEKINKTGDFLYKAFCIDGDVKFIKHTEQAGEIGLKYELLDSQRGKFFVTISKEI